jgi:U3 small nucleolar ribonucleoprotein component
MIKICGNNNKFYITYLDGSERLWMSSQIALILNLSVDQLNKMLVQNSGIEEDGSYYFSSIEDARKAREELDGVIIMNTMVSFEYLKK